jgi:hypothetical protein
MKMVVKLFLLKKLCLNSQIDIVIGTMLEKLEQHAYNFSTLNFSIT